MMTNPKGNGKGKGRITVFNLSLFNVRKVTDIIFGCASFGSKSIKSMECIENDGGSNSRAFLTQLIVCIVEAKFANDDEPAAIISKTQMSQ